MTLTRKDSRMPKVKQGAKEIARANKTDEFTIGALQHYQKTGAPCIIPGDAGALNRGKAAFVIIALNRRIAQRAMEKASGNPFDD